MKFVRWVETHKDFFLAIGVLLSPVAAVVIGLVTSKWQGKVLLESTRLQVEASALRDYRQGLIDKLREELAAQIWYVCQFRIKHVALGASAPGGLEMQEASAARRIRIHLLAAGSPVE